ncbi:hypothetical protein QAD02_009991 [Eretmocerus hayati]|uniref:Uncharacterized protein n=1 Tax=Eretmocerus hayati TaxID=131215 RepID=A0ACC2NC35_9HYME|nr:hypothetical protein QAD02_009991 [Eretmocerus hayati]
MASHKTSLKICLALSFLVSSAFSSPLKNQGYGTGSGNSKKQFLPALEFGKREKGDELLVDKKITVPDDSGRGQVLIIPEDYEMTQLRVIPPGFLGVRMASPFSSPPRARILVTLGSGEKSKRSFKGFSYWVQMYGKPIVCEDGTDQCKEDLKRWIDIITGGPSKF